MSIKYDCPFGEHQKRGLREYYICSKDSSLCRFTRWCATEHRVVFTKECEKCKARNNG